MNAEQRAEIAYVIRKCQLEDLGEDDTTHAIEPLIDAMIEQGVRESHTQAVGVREVLVRVEAEHPQTGRRLTGFPRANQWETYCMGCQRPSPCPTIRAVRALEPLIDAMIAEGVRDALSDGELPDGWERHKEARWGDVVDLFGVFEGPQCTPDKRRVVVTGPWENV